MKTQYQKPFVTIKRYSVATAAMVDTTSPLTVYPAGSPPDQVKYTLGTLNS